LHNGTSVPELSDAPPGTKVTNFTQFTNAAGTYNSASFNVGPKPSNESSANTTDNQTDPSNTTANANEASYKWGYNYAFSRYHNCQVSPNDCSVLLATDATYYCRDDQSRLPPDQWAPGSIQETEGIRYYSPDAGRYVTPQPGKTINLPPSSYNYDDLPAPWKYGWPGDDDDPGYYYDDDYYYGWS
jgi:hypothetical protein